MNYMQINDDFENQEIKPKSQMALQNPFKKFEMHPKTLLSLGFTKTDVSLMVEAVRGWGRVPVAELQQVGMTLEQAKKIRYAYDICTGKVVIETDDDLCKHLKKLFGQHERLGLQDLELSTVERVPRFAVVARIKDKIYKKLNSKNYPPDQRLYPVLAVSASRIIVKVDRNHKPAIPYGYTKKMILLK